MLGNHSWVTYAGDDAEAWKCIGLARSARRVGTRRRLAVFISDSISSEMRSKMDEAQFEGFFPLNGGGTTPFYVQAKEYFNNLRKFSGCVFIDPNCLMVKNSDFLFHQEGAHVVSGNEGRMERIIIGNNGGNVKKELLECVEELDPSSKYVAPIPRKEVTIICFENGHPLDKGLKPVGQVASEAVSLFRALCPEMFAQGTVYAPTGTENLKDSVAIIGLAGRYPGANNLDEFWNLLITGGEGIRRVPDDRWTPDKGIILMDNTRNTEAGFLSCPLENFDAKFFNINGADASFIDPQQRMALRVVWEALEHACIDPLSLKGSLTGVFGGWWKDDYKQMLQMLNIQAADFLRGYMGNGLGPLTARLSHFFDLIGPAFSTESGCSTSIAGVDMACSALRNEECHLAVSVGINLLLHPFALGFNKAEGLLASDGRCKVFDQSADGFGRAEGVGVLILKRYPDAIRDGDRIWGLIRGEAIVQEGISKSMGTPTVEVEVKAMELALHRAGVTSSDIDFLEMHATGTPVGDPIEAAAVARVYSREPRETPLLIGSVKGNTGHTESVCGITSIHKMVLAMKHEVIPKNINLKNMMPEIAHEFEKIPALVPLEHQAWKRSPDKPRICAINSFGITGAQANIIVQEPPETQPLPVWNFRDNRELKLLTFSGKFKDALQRNMATYIDFMSKEDSPDLRDIEYNMHVSRAHLHFRHVVSGKTKAEIIDKLKEDSTNLGKSIPNTPPKIGFLFTGQGSQYPGMGKSLYEQSSIFQSHFDWCESVLMEKHGLSLKEALWGFDATEKLKDTLYSQVGIFVIEYCLFRLFESWGIKPELVLGHSTGEFAACVAAGMMKPEDALHLVVTRSQLINSLPNGKMLVVMASLQKVKELLQLAFSSSENSLDIAAVNSTDQTVVSGISDIVEEFKRFCDNNGIKTVVLHSSHSFHSRMMEPILDEYGRVAETLNTNVPSPKCRFISSVEGREIQHSLDAGYWIRHTRQKVKFVEASKAAVQGTGISTFIEIGPSPVLSAFLMTNTDELLDDLTCHPSLRRNQAELEQILSTLGKLYCQGVSINWEGFHQHSGAMKVDIPGYSFDENQKYWVNIIDDGSAPFHPLVGKQFPNASGTWIFQSTLQLSNFGFLKDHLVQNKPIFLCAGYLEMLMAAINYAKTRRREMPSQPVGIKDFAIKVPILLDEANGTEFQVVVSPDAEGNLVGKIFTRMHLGDGDFKWVENATASAACIEMVNFPDLNDLKQACCVPLKEGIDYEEISKHGLQFGPSLRNAREGWEDPEGQKGFLFTYDVLDGQAEIDRFYVHPGITDPVLQMLGLEYGNATMGNNFMNKNLLLVPVQVGAFTKWSHSVPRRGYIHIQRIDGDHRGVIYAEDGKVAASIAGVEFLETTISNILALIDAEKNPYPSMAEIIWKEQLGPVEKRIRKEHMDEICFHDYETVFQTFKNFDAEEKLVYDCKYEAVHYLILRTFSELGVLDYDEFTWPKICDEVGVIPMYQKYFRFLLLELQKEGWIKQTNGDGSQFRREKPYPTKKEVEDRIKCVFEKGKSSDIFLEAYAHTKTFADNLKSIIMGETPALSVFFPDGESGMGLAEFCYTESIHARKTKGLSYLMGSVISDVAKKGKHVIRVLEVGAGVGSATRVLLSKMMDTGSHLFEYTYTDISSVFFKKGAELFENTNIPAKFQTFNLEEDPFQQGFIPEYFDVVVASLVVHATREMEESLAGIQKLLRPGGFLLMVELVRTNRTSDFMFGAIEGFWRFQDTQWRQWNCEAEPKVWKEILVKKGFRDFMAYEVYEDSTALLLARNGDIRISGLIQPEEKRASWIIFGNRDCALTDGIVGKLGVFGYSAVVLTQDALRSEYDVEYQLESMFNSEVFATLFLWGIQDNVKLDIGEPFLYICKFFHKLRLPYTMKFAVVTKGMWSTGPNHYATALPESSILVGMGNVLANESQDLKCKFVDYGDGMELSEVVDSTISELFLQDEEATVVFKDKHRFVPRLKPFKAQQSALPLPESQRYHLVVPNSNTVSDLRFASSEAQAIAEDDVEIQVKAYSLNFKDLLNVTKPDAVFQNNDTVGMDVCGVINSVGPKAAEMWKIGDRVVTARQFGSALPSHVVAKCEDLMSLPNEITFMEGSTLPAAAATVLTCLFHEIKVTKDDTVLIHTASGGVGLVAVQLLLNVTKCEVVVTAGTTRKRNYLRGLGVTHVFNSRNTKYGEDIRKALGGRGVTVVLNSITGPGFKEATLSLCQPGSKFIEMSKLNIWTVEMVRAMRPDVDYRIVDISSKEPGELRELNKQVSTLINQANSKNEAGLKPLCYVAFDCTEIRSALEYLEKVQHIGKICVRMREPKSSSDGCPFPLFNHEGCYLITGGLGGIGLEVAKWMTTQGAGNIILLGRNGPKPSAALQIDKMKEKANIVVKLCDVGNYKELESIMLSDEYPSIRGIMHCAGVIDDDPFDKQTWERYKNVFHGKVKGAWNLHLLSKKLKFGLEHFVLFSSMASNFGAPTQSNYASANSYLDALGRFRVSHGLPSLTVNWGQWAQVGMAKNIVSHLYHPFSVSKGIKVLEYALRSHKAHLCAYEVDLKVVKKSLPTTYGLLADADEGTSLAGDLMDSEKVFEEYDAVETRDEKREVIRRYIKQLLRITLKLTPSDEIDDNKEFQEMGLDSLMMVEIKNSMQSSMNKRAKITISAVKDYNTVSLLSTRLVELISGKEDAPALAREEIYYLVSKDWKLLTDVGHELPSPSTLAAVGNVSTVLVTGGKGSLGSYVVAQLAELPQIKKIFCLIRPNNTTTVTDLFRLTFMRKGLYTENVKQKVEIIEGDIAKTCFSLNKKTFLQLAEEVEAIFHLAAKVTFTERYQHLEEFNSSRKVNVDGTRTILTFALVKRLKHVFHASTLLVAMQMDEERQILSEAWRTVDEVNLLPDMAYLITKFVAEGFAEQSSKFGVPIKVFRFPYAGPDSCTGGNMEFAHLAMLRAFGYMYLGFMPTVTAPFNMLPVDVAAKLSLQVFFNPEAPVGIYNVCNPTTDDEGNFPSVAAEFGINVEILQPEEFKERIRNLPDGDAFKEVTNIYGDGGSYVVEEKDIRMFMDMEAPFYQAWLEGNRNLYRSEKVERYASTDGIPTSFEVYKAALRAAKKEGYFDKFKIPYTQ